VHYGDGTRMFAGHPAAIDTEVGAGAVLDGAAVTHQVMLLVLRRGRHRVEVAANMVEKPPTTTE
jgi:hypothetical protein